MHKIGIIGAGESVTAFLALGVTVFEALTPAEAAAQLHKAAATGEYAVLFIDEALAAAIPRTWRAIRMSRFPPSRCCPVRMAARAMVRQRSRTPWNARSARIFCKPRIEKWLKEEF